VAGFRVGQPVAALLNDFGRGPRAGGYAEVAVAHVTMATALPEDADLARVAAVLVNGVTAWIALHHLARLRVTDDVLVLGAELTGGRGVDVVVDPVGGQLRTLAFDRLAAFGRLVVPGNASGQDEPVSGDAAWLGTRQLIGFSLGGVAHLLPDQISAATTAVVDLLRRDVLREPAPVILPPDQVADAHRALEDRSAPAKTVLAIHGR